MLSFKIGDVVVRNRDQTEGSWIFGVVVRVDPPIISSSIILTVLKLFNDDRCWNTLGLDYWYGDRVKHFRDFKRELS